ncbi:hypothetical protein EK21DRAFT_98930 [Setomelanomma holmii]|uniref:Uncharacterized protein n=1 Tax=Setomelanomma holmii TaxID=210430 RepID=A0A9P4HCL4_9PLEO|nr:hypothetical protein EK21DRAFT_98930 [Setomelanomma holmii]
MKPGSLPMRLRSRPVCQLCDFISQQPARRRAFASISTLKAPSTRNSPARRHVATPRTFTRGVTTTTASAFAEPFNAPDEALPFSDRIAAVKGKLAEVEAQIKAIYDSPKIESEDAILRVLDELEDVARLAIAIRSRQPLPAKAPIRQSSAGAILSGLSGEENGRASKIRTKSKSFGLDALPSPAYLSQLAEDFIRHEKVFMSPNVLGLYIHLQRLLARPKTIPEALYLFANKPVPVEGSSPPKFAKPSPKAAKQAVPADLADEALTAAIEAKDLTLALAVVDHTYRAPAWRRHRMITKMGLPSVLAAMTPLAIYMIAQEMSVYSGYIDPWTFKLYAFAGISTYVMCTGTLGFVALTTYNDHHDRVVWRPGVPLLDRYVREDERAALDRIACAWGFKEVWRRGDEEGDEWEGLRQWILLRGMVLDKPELMHGMNPGR